MTWTVKFAASVRKTVQKLDPLTRKRIHEFLENRVGSLNNPRSIGKPLKGNFTELWRYRIGDYRIICEIRDEELLVLVLHIGHRSTIYRKK